MKKVIWIVSVFVVSMGVLVFGSLFFPGDSHAQALKGWCCLNGQVFPATDVMCKEKQGKFALTQAEALRLCPPPAKCWCCVNGEIVQTTVAVCKEKQGNCYETKELAQQRCQKHCYCCINGAIVETAPAMCKEKGGTCYWTKEDAARCQKAQ
jgi:hypothetical protein